METWIVTGFLGAIIAFLAVVLVALYLKTRSIARPPRISNPEQVAAELGFTYEHEPERVEHTSLGGLGKQWEIIQWRIAGNHRRRPVKLEKKFTRTRGTGDTVSPEIPHVSLEVPCRMLPGFHLFLSRAENVYLQKGYREVHLQRADRADATLNGRLRGSLKLQELQKLDIIEVLSYAPETGPTCVEAVDGKIHTWMDFGNQAYELDASLVDRSIQATTELAEAIEQTTGDQTKPNGGGAR